MKRQAAANAVVEASVVKGNTKDILWQKQDELNFPVDLDKVKHSGQVGRVTIAGGITKNLGDFESLRINVQLELPYFADVEHLESAYNYGKAWVAEKINELTEEAVTTIEDNDGF